MSLVLALGRRRKISNQSQPLLHKAYDQTRLRKSSFQGLERWLGG